MDEKFPKGETLKVSYCDRSGRPAFFLTAKDDQFFLYEASEKSGPKKLGKGRSPLELEIKFCVNDVILGMR